VEPVGKKSGLESSFKSAMVLLQKTFPGIQAKDTEAGWQILIPDKYRVGHEAHFGQVMQRYLQYLVGGQLPDWEVPNMLAKYYTTTQALELTR